ncbi:SREBP regulating gene protein-like [Tubulanus polymorphus]|uniref:SREBP regulating gene protein-like n=1 Tax=Tubulanus polymorphus TaxID=672921 RepID=UPI003DA5BE77
MFGSRILRKRWVLVVIFGLSLLYFLHATLFESNLRIKSDEYVMKKRRVIPELFQWQPKYDKKNASLIKTCRNSVQGKSLIADERGYVCDRLNILPGGCCDIKSRSTKHYICDSCLQNGCCNIYEHCVSCCLQPEKQPLLRKILGKAADALSHIFASVTDHFELCLAKCRTSSQSVQHENSYRDPAAKFCYGENAPNLQPQAAS